MNTSEFREALTGPIPSLCTPFRKDGSIDFDGLRNVIDFVIAAGAKTLLLTAGDSHYECLSDEEIAQVTRVTCEHAAGRAMVVAADRYFSTDRACAFADFCREAGADVYMSLPPDWGASCTKETLVAHYAAVARRLPLMIVTNFLGSRGADFALEVIAAALDRVEPIAGIKDDVCGEFARRLCLLAHDRCPVFAGGQKQNHMNMHPYGVDGYLSTFLNFKPEVAHAYWSAIEANDLPAARRVIADIDMPFFQFISSLPGGFDAGVHAAYEVFGVAGRWRRPPYYSLSDEEMERVADFFRVRGLL